MFLGAAAGIAGTALVGFGATSRSDGESHDHSGTAAPSGEAVECVRNVEEVRGHLTSSATLLKRGRMDGAALHTGHGSDYFAAVLPAVRNENAELATRLRAAERSARTRRERRRGGLRSLHYREVYPLLDEAVAAVVREETRELMPFDVRVMNALAGRIAEEYSAAVSPAGEIELAGEYWDARGFLTRMEAHYLDFESELDEETRSEVSEEFEILRTELETARPPWDVANSVTAMHEFLNDFAGVSEKEDD